MSRRVEISQTVRIKKRELADYLVNHLFLSDEAAMRRMDRMDKFLASLAGPGDYALCRYAPWRRLGYRCVPFEKTWIFAYEIFEGGILIRDMRHGATLQ